MKIAICDTDKMNAREIAKSIHRLYAEDDIRYFTNLFALVTYIYDERKGDIDLVILQTDIDGEDGIEAARSIQEFYPGIQIIFTANLTARIQDVFRTKLLYLLIRPFEDRHLEEALRYAHEQYTEALQKTITLKFKGNLFRIRISIIDYVESAGRRLYIYTSENKWEINMKMEEIRSLLPSNFVLCHRSYLVNIDHIMKIDSAGIELFNHMRIPVARGRSAEIMQRLMKR